MLHDQTIDVVLDNLGLLLVARRAIVPDLARLAHGVDPCDWIEHIAGAFQLRIVVLAAAAGHQAAIVESVRWPPHDWLAHAKLNGQHAIDGSELCLQSTSILVHDAHQNGTGQSPLRGFPIQDHPFQFFVIARDDGSMRSQQNAPNLRLDRLANFIDDGHWEAAGRGFVSLFLLQLFQHTCGTVQRCRHHCGLAQQAHLLPIEHFVAINECFEVVPLFL